MTFHLLSKQCEVMVCQAEIVIFLWLGKSAKVLNAKLYKQDNQVEQQAVQVTF